MHTLLVAFQVHVGSSSSIPVLTLQDTTELFRGLHTCVLPLLPRRPCGGDFPESITCPNSAIESTTEVHIKRRCNKCKHRYHKPMWTTQELQRRQTNTGPTNADGTNSNLYYIHHTVATDKQRAVQYLINKNTFNNTYHSC